MLLLLFDCLSYFYSSFYESKDMVSNLNLSFIFVSFIFLLFEFSSLLLVFSDVFISDSFLVVVLEALGLYPFFLAWSSCWFYSNQQIMSGISERCLMGSHVFYVQPFHLMRYSTFWPFIRLSRIFSTSQSGSIQSQSEFILNLVDFLKIMINFSSELSSKPVHKNDRERLNFTLPHCDTLQLLFDDGFIIIMEPEDNNNQTGNFKSTENPITRQINRYRNALPEVPRAEGHFFFKEIIKQLEEISYVSIGYRVGTVPFQLNDLMAVVVNCIHYSCELNLKLIMDEDQLWVTSSMGVSSQQMNSLHYREEQAHLNESLLKTQRIIAQFLQELRSSPRQDDELVLQRVKKQIVRQIHLVFKNPDLDD